MGYLKDVVRGVSWMGTYRVAYRLVGIARIAILARILLPSDFGIFGIAMLLLGLLEIVTESGINYFLIQEKSKIDDYIDTAWVVAIVRGALISLLIVIFAYPAANFFHSDNAPSIILLVALVPLIRGLINPSIVKLQKELQFRKEFLYRVSVFIVEAVSSISFALITKSAAGLVLGLILAAVYEVIVTFIIVGPKPVFAFDKAKFRAILGRGKWITGFGIFDYIYTQSDNIVVARYLGQAALGIYDNAYTISTTPLTEIGDVFFRVTFPVFSKIAGDKTRLKAAFVKNILINSALMVPAGIALFLLAKPVVVILLGPNWLGAVPVIKLLSVLGVVRGIANSTNSLLVALQKQKYSAIITFTSAVGLWLTILPLVQKYGLLGAGASAIIGVLVSLPFTVYFVFRSLR